MSFLNVTFPDLFDFNRKSQFWNLVVSTLNLTKFENMISHITKILFMWLKMNFYSSWVSAPQDVFIFICFTKLMQLWEDLHTSQGTIVSLDKIQCNCLHYGLFAGSYISRSIFLWYSMVFENSAKDIILCFV